MSYPPHASIEAYITDRIQTADVGASVVTANSTDMAAWLERSTYTGRSYLISYDGYIFNRSHENRPVGRSKGYSVFWHGRAMGGEATMDAITTAIHAVTHFTIDAKTHIASVAGGRYLLMDRGFDTYQLELTINT